MKEIQNKSMRDLSTEEWLALVEVSKILEKTFKRKIFALYLNPPQGNPNDIGNVNIVLDMNS